MGSAKKNIHLIGLVVCGVIMFAVFFSSMLGYLKYFDMQALKCSIQNSTLLTPVRQQSRHRHHVLANRNHHTISDQILLSKDSTALAEAGYAEHSGHNAKGPTLFSQSFNMIGGRKMTGPRMFTPMKGSYGGGSYGGGSYSSGSTWIFVGSRSYGRYYSSRTQDSAEPLAFVDVEYKDPGSGKSINATAVSSDSSLSASEFLKMYKKGAKVDCWTIKEENPNEVYFSEFVPDMFYIAAALSILGVCIISYAAVVAFQKFRPSLSQKFANRSHSGGNENYDHHSVTEMQYPNTNL